MTLMERLVDYVNKSVHLVSSDELVNFAVYNGYSAKQTSGAVGSAVRNGKLTVIYTKYIKGRKINFFN